jgi:hypothetical protein
MRNFKSSRASSREKRLERELRSSLAPKNDNELYQQAVQQNIPQDLLNRMARGRHDVTKPMDTYAMDIIDELAVDSTRASEYGADLGNPLYVFPEAGEAGPGGQLIYGNAGFGSDYTEVPTSTSNAARPRTVAAAYDPERQVITIMFRDGTVYNYYECSMDEWDLFHGETSKGPVIKEFLDTHPRGPADTSDFPEEIRQKTWLLSRSLQAEAYSLKQTQEAARKQKQFFSDYDKAFKEYKRTGYRAPILDEGLNGKWSE